MAALREVVAIFDIQVKDAALRAAGGAVNGMSAALKGMGNLIAGAAILGGIRTMTNEMVDLGSGINDMSARVGVGTTELQKWQYVIGQTGGSAGDAEPLFRTLAKNISSVDGAASKAGPVLKDLLGADYTTEGKALGTVARDAADAISKLEDGPKKAALSLELFGKAGTKLLPVFKEGKEGFDAMIETYESFGGGLTEDAIAALDDMGDMTDNYTLAMNGLKAQIVVGIAPAFTKFIGIIGRTVSAFKNNKEAAGHMKNMLIGVGLVAAAAGASALAPWLGLLAIMVGVALVADDVITAFEGGDSAIGRLLDKVFGQGAGQSIFKQIKADVKDLAPEVGKAEGAIDKMGVVAKRIGSSIATFFSKDIPEAISLAFGMNSSVEAGWSGLLENLGAAFGAWIGKIKSDIRQAVQEAFPGLVSAIEKIQGLVNGDEASQGTQNDRLTRMASKGSDGPSNLTDMINILHAELPGNEALRAQQAGASNAVLPGQSVTNTITSAPIMNVTIHGAVDGSDAANSAIGALRRFNGEANRATVNALVTAAPD